MTDAAQVLALVQEALDSDRTPEDVCADTPAFLPEVRRRLEQCRRLGAEIEDLFATSDGTPTPTAALPTTLPTVPGYEVEAILGRGGMGVVYKARQLKLKRRVALKMILAGAHAGASELHRFMREAEAVASLRHAHIVQVYDVGDLDGLPYFTMEYVEGGTLAQKLAGTPQPARGAAELMRKLATAVHAAHEAGIVHRDLKPGNILLTSDGTPKIADFGLALHFGEEHGITLSGARIGTPSYMAPEQAAGRPSAVGPPADIYSLGAILYELLTGRPPFRAETTSETILQVIYQEPAAPSRLNAKVSRDLETICLKCLHKEPYRRYASAAALGEDLVRFLEDRPILARPPGWAGRCLRWCRRKPASAALIAAVLAFVGLSVGGGFWIQHQKAEIRAVDALQEGRTTQAVEAALTQAAKQEEEGHWPEAQAVLKSAPELSTTSPRADLRERIRRARADADMVADLEGIRLSEDRKSTAIVAPNGTRIFAEDELYSTAFRKYGITLTMPPAEAAAIIRAAPIRLTLLAFLHDWLYFVNESDRSKVRALVELADDDPWRREVRQALASKDGQKLRLLAGAPDGPAQPPVIVSGLANALYVSRNGDDALALLREAQRRHPGDFWINYQLGQFTQQDHPQEAVGYLRAALAARPKSEEAYTLLGQILRDAGDADGAIDALFKVISINPSHAGVWELAKLLAPKGRLAEARVVWDTVLANNPTDYAPWYGYAQLCLYLGDEPAYRKARTALLNRFGETNDSYITERTSLAVLLEPMSGEDQPRIVKIAERAISLGAKPPDRPSPYLEFLQGLFAYRQGQFEKAMPLLRDSADVLPNRPGSRLVLAMAQFQAGSVDEARKSFATAVRNYNWKPTSAGHTTVWVSHVFRREAEAMLLPNLPAFLKGEYKPTENQERLSFLGICESEGRYAAVAQLCADAFAADPKLADELTTDCMRRAAAEESNADRIESLNTECRYVAARCAALAVSGAGTDSATLSDADRARLAAQARDWLLADLALWSQSPDENANISKRLQHEMMTAWLTEPDLASLRDAAPIKGQSEADTTRSADLWNKVRAAAHASQ